MTAHELVARHLDARGGLHRLEAIQTLRQRGTVRTPDYTVEIYGERKRPNLLRIEFTIDGTTGIEGWDGTAAWEFNPWKGMTQAEYVTGGPAIALERGSEFDGPLVNYRQKGHTIEYIGREEWEGREVYNLKITRNDGNVIYHYLEIKSLLVVRTVSLRHVHGKDPAETTTFFEDYREVAGVLFPFRSVEHAKDGAHNEMFQWDTIEANVLLDDSRFRLPNPLPRQKH